MAASLWKGSFTRNFKVAQKLSQTAYSVGIKACTIHRKYASTLEGKTVRIGCASGFWGDTSVSAPQLIYSGRIDYLVFDYLSEITMSLLTAARAKSPNMGYAPDFVHLSIAPFIKDIKRKGIRVISNAGGINPLGCAAAVKEACKAADVDLNIAVITGDDLMKQLGDLSKADITDMVSGKSFPKTMHSMTAYLGAGPIARALDNGADIVITGRCVDSALILAPLIHEFKWSMNNYDLLASGSLAGHLVECGAHATGGNFTDWEKVQDWDNIGFPIVECDSYGATILSKPPDTGGLVSKATVSEQMLYEVGDPANYILPDVICDFSNVQLKELPEPDHVFIQGARGKPPPSDYKVSGTFADGYRATAVSFVGGPKSKQKIFKNAEAILKRCRRVFKQLNYEDFENVNLEIFGTEHIYGPHAKVQQDVREAVMWLAVHHRQKKALEFFSREVAPAGTGMSPGFMNIIGGRPRVSPVLKLFLFLLPKDKFDIELHMNGTFLEKYQADVLPSQEPIKVADTADQSEPADLSTGSCTFRLEDLAYTRSGDKGNSVNIGVIARHPVVLPYLRQALTADSVEQYFSHFFADRNGPVSSRVTRYDAPGIYGMNFMLHSSLGGGGIASLRSDPQGKAVGQMLLDFEIENVPNLVEMMSESDK